MASNKVLDYEITDNGDNVKLRLHFFQVADIWKCMNHYKITTLNDKLDPAILNLLETFQEITVKISNLKAKRAGEQRKIAKERANKVEG